MVTLFVYYGSENAIINADDVPKTGGRVSVDPGSGRRHPEVFVTGVHPTQADEHFFFRVYGGVVERGVLC